jgi:hypothetical protein
MNISAYKLNLASSHNYLRVESESVKRGSNGTLITVSTKEKESLSISASGFVQTKDKNISIDLQAELFSESTMTLDVAAYNGKRIDPLVINLSGGLAQTDKIAEFDFDLDSDGKMDKISALASQNGFLALDADNNGKIDNGNELFGTKSGNGFADLAKYDGNKDGVIDESDSIFEKLKIWTKTAASDKLISLKEAKVGALLLDNINSEFELKNQNRVNAKIQKSGIAIFEDGMIGWVSHVDFAVHGKGKEEPNSVSAVKAEWGKAVVSEVDDKYKLEVKPTNILEFLKKRLEELEADIKKEGNKTKKQQLEMQKMALNEQIALLEKGGLKI